jgi:hypothetical protein
MAPELAALVEAGRELAPEDRYELAHQMLISVDEPAQDQAEVDAAWKVAFRRRIDDIESAARRWARDDASRPRAGRRAAREAHCVIHIA